MLRQLDPDRWTFYDPLEDPINERAWTLEERLLSPRRLIFSKNHVRWLCETSEHTNGGDVEDRKFLSSSNQRPQIERFAAAAIAEDQYFHHSIYIFQS